jgi:hypothetical protein
MIGSLVAIISLNTTLSLIQDYGVVAQSLIVSGATVTSPITVSVPDHNIPPGRVMHGVLTGMTGMTEANGLWVFTPVDANTLALSTFTAQGIPVDSAATNAWTGGGIIQYAFPDFQILLGRRLVALTSSVASPRICFIPTDGRAWGFEPYGSAGNVDDPNGRGTLEQQSMVLQPQLATQFSTFEVLVSGCANPPSPDFLDFDATQQIVDALYGVLFDATGGLPRAKILHESWPSQLDEDAQAATGSMTQRGQQWRGILELQRPVTKVRKTFVQIGTYIEFTVEPVNPLVPTDQTVFDVLPP